MSEQKRRVVFGSVVVLLLVVFMYGFMYSRTTPPTPRGDVVLKGQEVSHTTALQQSEESHMRERTLMTVGNAEVRAEVVRTREDLTRGLSGRKTLEEGEGMLFVFSRMDTVGIWMPDMHFAIDIVWLDDLMRVVHVHANATPESYPEVFYPPGPARYVLEVPAGYAEAYGITTGMVAEMMTIEEAADLP